MIDNLPPQLTLSQLQGATKDLVSQGAPREVAQKFLDSYETKDNQNYTLKTTTPAQPVTPTQGNQDIGVNGDLFKPAGNATNDNASKVLNSATSSVQNFAKDIAQGFYLAFGGQNKIDAVAKQHLDNAAKLTDLIKGNQHPEMNDQWKKMAVEQVTSAQNIGGKVLGNVRTPEQIVGDAIGTGADVLGAGDYSGIAKGVGLVEKPAASIIGAVGKGAVKGAIQGGAYGAAKGAATGMSDNQNAHDVGVNALKGAVEGAAGGAVIGAVAGGVGAAKEGKTLLAPKTPKQELAKIQETISPKPTVKEAKLAENQGRLVKGKEPTLLRGGTEDTVLPSKKTIRAAQTIQQNIPGAANMDEASLYKALNSKTAEIAQKLKPEMQSVSVTPKVSDSVTSAWQDLKKVQINDVPASEEANVTKLQSKFEAVVNKVLGKDNLTMQDVWDARQAYDQSIKEAVKKANTLSSESLQMQKEIWLQNRAILNGAINDSSSGLGKTSQKAFLDMHDMYSSKEGILSKAKINTKVQPSKLVQLVKKHPIIDSIIGTLGIGEIGRKVLTGHF